MKNTTQYVRCSTEKVLLDKKIVDAFVIVLRTRGCKWALESGCSMCGYISEAAQRGVSDKDLLTQFSAATKKLRNEKQVKIFTSGSFLDLTEISEAAQVAILKQLGDKVEKVTLESRPEFIVRERLEKLKKVCKLEIALGLESANEIVLERAINKGFKLEDYIRAAKVINELKIPLKTYILIKPPFLTEREAILDAINSAKFAATYSQTLSFNPVNVQKNTLVEFLWKRKEYFPPWLWSVVEILEKTKLEVSAQLTCAPVGGGSLRGTHNCGKCDSELLRAIREFSLTQNEKLFKSLDCECKQEWLDLLELEGFAQSCSSL